MTTTFITDTECFRNHWSIGFKRVEDGKKLVLRKDDQHELDTGRLRKIVTKGQLVTYNGNGYDRAMIWGAIYGMSNDALKEMSDAIINDDVPWWRTCDLLGEFCPAFKQDFGTWWPTHDFIDLIEPQPNAVAGLKTLNGRLHAKRLQDLPYEPSRILTPYEMEQVIEYMTEGDLEGTHMLWDALAEPMQLREALGGLLGLDLRSKSDTQMGFALLKKRVEDSTRKRIAKGDPNRMIGKSFKYEIPKFIHFKTKPLQDLLERIRETDFKVKANGRVELPKWLATEKIAIGSSTYTMGIGGLHSNESNRSVWSDENWAIYDADVGSFYPKTIVNLGLFPPAMGPAMLPVYDGLRLERLEDKHAGRKTQAEGKKISLNGFFGLTSQPHSPAYHPPMTIAITLTGQLALLMLIERLELGGFHCVSANTDGVTFRGPRHRMNKIGKGDVLVEQDGIDMLKDITDGWMRESDYDLEFVEYKSLHNLSVNTYFAIKPDGKVKRKGILANPWKDPKAIRERLMKNPQMTICSDAALQYILDGTPVEETIRACRDFTQFVTVVNVQGGGIWGGEEIPNKPKATKTRPEMPQDEYEASFGREDFDFLGKVVRYYWGHYGAPIYYKTPNEDTGNYKKVSKSDGARPAMELPDNMPTDIDYERYFAEARQILVDVGVVVEGETTGDRDYAYVESKRLDEAPLSDADIFNILVTF